MPFSYAVSIVGPIMKILKKSAKLTSTTFGGDCCNPRAFLRNEKTITIRVKDVVIIAIEGASVKIPIIKTV